MHSLISPAYKMTSKTPVKYLEAHKQLVFLDYKNSTFPVYSYDLKSGEYSQTSSLSGERECEFSGLSPDFILRCPKKILEITHTEGNLDVYALVNGKAKKVNTIEVFQNERFEVWKMKNRSLILLVRNKLIRLVDPVTGTLIHTFKIHPVPVSDSNLILTSSNELSELVGDKVEVKGKIPGPFREGGVIGSGLYFFVNDNISIARISPPSVVSHLMLGSKEFEVLQEIKGDEVGVLNSSVLFIRNKEKTILYVRDPKSGKWKMKETFSDSNFRILGEGIVVVWEEAEWGEIETNQGEVLRKQRNLNGKIMKWNPVKGKLEVVRKGKFTVSTHLLSPNMMASDWEEHLAVTDLSTGRLISSVRGLTFQGFLPPSPLEFSQLTEALGALIPCNKGRCAIPNVLTFVIAGFL